VDQNKKRVREKKGELEIKVVASVLKNARKEGEGKSKEKGPQTPGARTTSREGEKDRQSERS